MRGCRKCVGVLVRDHRCLLDSSACLRLRFGKCEANWVYTNAKVNYACVRREGKCHSDCDVRSPEWDPRFGVRATIFGRERRSDPTFLRRHSTHFLPSHCAVAAHSSSCVEPLVARLVIPSPVSRRDQISRSSAALRLARASFRRSVQPFSHSSLR